MYPGTSLRLAKLVESIHAGECSWLPTVTARDYRSPGNQSHPRLTASRGEPLPETIGARITPELCEWLMGFPAGWTELPESVSAEMLSSLKSPKSSGGL